jgi:iron-sulfur cluster assembly protein
VKRPLPASRPATQLRWYASPGSGTIPLQIRNDRICEPYAIVSSSDDVSETSGLRMVAEQAGAQMNLQLSIASLPSEDDEVIEEHGARIFLEPAAASLPGDKVLDASVEQNQVAFTIADQVEE